MTHPHLVFDLDGTLVSCRERQSAVLAHVAGYMDVACDVSAVWALKRQGMSTKAALIETGVLPDHAKAINSQWIRCVESPYWLQFDRILPNVLATLQNLKSTQSKITVLTARSRPSLIRTQLTRLGLSDFLPDVVVVSPSAAKAEKSAWLFSNKPLIFVGDTESDLEAAVASATPFFGVSTGQRTANYLTESGADHVFDSFDAAISALDLR